MVAVSSLLNVTFLVVPNGVRSATAFTVLLALLGTSVNPSVGLYFVYVTRLADTATTATSLSVLTMFARLGNPGAPAAGGWFIETVSRNAGFGVAAVLVFAGLRDPRASRRSLPDPCPGRHGFYRAARRRRP